MGKRLCDLLGMFSDFLKRLRTVEMLTSGDEPHLKLFQVDYHSFLSLHTRALDILSIDMEVAVMELGHVFWGDFIRLAKLQGEPGRTCHVFHHHRCLDGCSGCRTDREDPVILQEYCGRLANVLNHLPADFLTTNQGKTRAGNRAPKFVRDSREEDGNRVAEGGKGGGVGGVGVDHAVDIGTMPVDVEVAGCIGRGLEFALNDLAVQVDHHVILCSQLIVKYAARLNHHQSTFWITCTDIASCPDY